MRPTARLTTLALALLTFAPRAASGAAPGEAFVNPTMGPALPHSGLRHKPDLRLLTAPKTRAAEHPDRDFLKFGNGPWISYGEVNKRTNQVANALIKRW